MKKIWLFFAITLLLAVFISPFASSLPDGLEWVAQQTGFSHKIASAPVIKALLPEYEVPGLTDSPLGSALSAVIGTLLCFFLPFTFYLLRRK